MPANGTAVMLTIGDIHGAIDQHGKAQTAAGTELQHAHTALDTIAQSHQAHACELGQLSGMRRQIAARVGSFE
jgi:hypothetical protein